MKEYSNEYKQEAVRLVTERGRKVCAVARELGISHWTLRDWVRKRTADINAHRLMSGQLSPDEENKLLRKELAEIREERDILKKAIAVFSKKPKISTDL